MPAQIKGMGFVDGMTMGLRFVIFLDSSKGSVLGAGSNIYGQQCYFDKGEPTNKVTPVRPSSADTSTICLRACLQVCAHTALRLPPPSRSR